MTAGLDFSGLLERTSHGVAEAPSAAAPPPPSATTATSATLGAGALGPAPAPSRTPPATAGEQPVTPLAPGVRPPRRTARLPISAVPKADPIVAPPPGPPPPPPGAGTGLGEHDGRTITLADLRRVQDDAADPRPRPDDTAAPPGSPGTAPPRSGEVRAVRCPAGHANPPTATTCRLCGQAVTDTTVMTIPRPVIARLVFDSGLIVDVDRPQLIGRRPSSPPEAEEIPNLVTIPSPDSEISRAHAAVRVEGWDVLVEDVGSTNGTEVRLPGRDPVRLREHDPVLVVAGTEVTLAAVVRFQVEAPSCRDDRRRTARPARLRLPARAGPRRLRRRVPVPPASAVAGGGGEGAAPDDLVRRRPRRSSRTRPTGWRCSRPIRGS